MGGSAGASGEVAGGPAGADDPAGAVGARGAEARTRYALALAEYKAVEAAIDDGAHPALATLDGDDRFEQRMRACRAVLKPWWVRLDALRREAEGGGPNGSPVREGAVERRLVALRWGRDHALEDAKKWEASAANAAERGDTFRAGLLRRAASDLRSRAANLEEERRALATARCRATPAGMSRGWVQRPAGPVRVHGADPPPSG